MQTRLASKKGEKGGGRISSIPAPSSTGNRPPSRRENDRQLPLEREAKDGEKNGSAALKLVVGDGRSARSRLASQAPRRSEDREVRRNGGPRRSLELQASSGGDVGVHKNKDREREREREEREWAEEERERRRERVAKEMRERDILYF